MFEASHIPVLCNECLSFLKQKNGLNNLLDCNLGEGGHSELFLNNFENLNIVGIDRDKNILERAEERLSKYKNRISFVNEWSDIYLENNKSQFDCIFFDLGISMYHYKSSGRGFGFGCDEKLDMRLNLESDLSAWDVVNKYSEKRLSDVIYYNSDERKAKKIAHNIVESRKGGTIDSTFALRDIVLKSFSSYERAKSKINLSTKTFQAIRIEVNSELEHLRNGINRAVDALNNDGLLMMISFHSLEDRIVKWSFRNLYNDNKISILTKRPMVASKDETIKNPASRSAKLRVARRII